MAADKKPTTQVERLQAYHAKAYSDGARWGECNGALGAVRRMIADRGLLCEITGRAIVADLQRRFGAEYVTAHLVTHGLLELAHSARTGQEIAVAVLEATMPAGLNPGRDVPPAAPAAEDYDPLADEGP